MNTVRFFLSNPLLTMNNGEVLVAGGHGKHATLRDSHMIEYVLLLIKNTIYLEYNISGPFYKANKIRNL